MPTVTVTISNASWTQVVPSSDVKFTAQPNPGSAGSVFFRFGTTLPVASIGDGLCVSGQQAVTRDHGEGNLYARGNGAVVVTT